MMAEVGIPIALTLRYEVNPLLLRGGEGDPDAWRLVPRRRPLSRGYLAGIAAAIGTCVLLPYGEELLRCVRTGRKNDKSNKISRKGR
ncbi:hypothetical protein [Streptomyces violaceus]|uniref:hypothetical protein n=1 Tax=Streptomyces violaceus TaxID=1936 RepID=UPI0039A515D3